MENKCPSCSKTKLAWCSDKFHFENKPELENLRKELLHIDLKFFSGVRKRATFGMTLQSILLIVVQVSLALSLEEQSIFKALFLFLFQSFFTVYEFNNYFKYSKLENRVKEDLKEMGL